MILLVSNPFSRRTPIALKNLWGQKSRTMVGALGVAVALVLIFMQLGFFMAVVKTATVVLGRLNFDVLLVSHDYQHMYQSGTFPRARLFQASADPDVISAEPMYLGLHLWRCPPASSGEPPARRAIFIMAFRPPRDLGVDGKAPADFPLPLPDVERQLDAARQPKALLLDLESRPEFGRPGDRDDWELGRRDVRMVGGFHLGTGFGADGAVIMTDENFHRIFPHASLDSVSLGLLRVRPGADPNEVAARLRKILPADVMVRTRWEVLWREVFHWVSATGVGVIFSAGVVIAFLVGVGVVYQVLSSDIADHYAEYATLKAMGYANGFLSRIILVQSVLLAVVGFAPAMVAARGLFAYTESRAHIPMDLDVTLGLAVLILAVLMCVCSGLLAIRKVQSTDPAALF